MLELLACMGGPSSHHFGLPTSMSTSLRRVTPRTRPTGLRCPPSGPGSRQRMSRRRPAGRLTSSCRCPTSRSCRTFMTCSSSKVVRSLVSISISSPMYESFLSLLPGISAQPCTPQRMYLTHKLRTMREKYPTL